MPMGEAVRFVVNQELNLKLQLNISYRVDCRGLLVQL